MRQFQQEKLHTARVMERIRADDPESPAATMPGAVRSFLVGSLGADSMLVFHMLGFAKVTSADQFARLPPHEVLARWLEAHDPWAKMLRQYRDVSARLAEGGMTAPVAPDLTRGILGTVAQSDSVVHVVFRQTVRTGLEEPRESIGIASVHYTAEGWRLVVNEDLFGYQLTGITHLP